MKPIILRAKLRKYEDSDINDAVRSLNLRQGQMAVLVRQGVRMALDEMGVLGKVKPISETNQMEFDFERSHNNGNIQDPKDRS